MRIRRLARRLALDVLYEAEIRLIPPLETWDLATDAGWALSSDSDDLGGLDAALPYARTLVEGVQNRQREIDGLISEYADRWAIERMPVIDRVLLRLAIFELLWREDVPPAVSINEAVEIAKDYSTGDSARFINGILGRVAERVASSD